jgi:GTP-sensing pleiotropic transcriptional regulator CodY
VKLSQNQITMKLNSLPYTDINAITSIIDEDIPPK